MELRVQDLRLRGPGFTLFPAAEEHGIKDDLMDFLVFALYTKLGLCSDDYESEEAIKKSNPKILDTIATEDVEKILSRKNYGVQDLLSNDLVTRDGNNLVLTEKSIAILNKAAETQAKLDAETFHCCPCSGCH